MRYDVVIVGFRLNASLKPAQALQLVLGLDAETSKELTRRFPAGVLSGVSLSRAERVSQELTDAGAKVEVRESRLSLAAEARGSAGEQDDNNAGTGSGTRGAAAPEPSNGARQAVIEELPDGSRRTPPHSERAEEASGNYEIGEILAPLGRGRASSPAPAADLPTPATRRASREELDQALRDSLRPEEASAAAAAPSAPPPKVDARDRDKPAPSTDEFELMDNSAFAGMQNFGGGLDGFNEQDAPNLQVDEVALRSIQRRREDVETQAASKHPVLRTRLGSWWSDFSVSALDWGTALFSLLVVAGITVLAVGYALDPEHVLRPVGLETLPDSAKKLFADLFGK